MAKRSAGALGDRYKAVGQVGIMGVTPGGGGGHSGTEWLPTAKQPRGAEAVNVKI